MFQAIVHIQSKINQSFGTGFVIEQNSTGVYILTCKHVLNELGSYQVEDLEAKLIVQGELIDLALLHVQGLYLEPLPLQVDKCIDEQVEVIGFSSFNQNFHQKHKIEAKLYDEPIELHSSTDERYYEMRKIESIAGHTFSRGNSGSPVICQNTGKVMAVLSNKKGHQIAYAIPITYLEDIWKDIPSQLIKIKVKDKNNPSPLEKNLNHFTLNLVKNGWIGKRAYNKVKEFQSENGFFIDSVLGTKNIKTLTTFSKIKEKIKTTFISIFWIFTLTFGGYWGFKTFMIVNYKVINIKVNSTLNVRKGINKNHKIIAELAYNANSILVHNCKLNTSGKKWCHIQYFNIQGWVRSKYISIDKVTLK